MPISDLCRSQQTIVCITWDDAVIVARPERPRLYATQSDGGGRKKHRLQHEEAQSRGRSLGWGHAAEWWRDFVGCWWRATGGEHGTQ